MISFGFSPVSYLEEDHKILPKSVGILSPLGLGYLNRRGKGESK